jgi:hypothetical protein
MIRRIGESIDQNIDILTEYDIVVDKPDRQQMRNTINRFDHMALQSNISERLYDKIFSVKCSEQNIDTNFFNIEREKKIMELEGVINLLLLSDSIKKYDIIAMLGNRTMKYYHPNDDINNNNLIDKKMQMIVLFPLKDFINSVLSTYPDDDSIMKQFLADFHRHNVSINGELVKSIDRFITILSKYNRPLNTSYLRKQISLLLFSMVLVCQSSYYISFNYIHDKLIKLKQKNSNMSDLHIVDSRVGKKINIIVSDYSNNALCCSISGSYKIINCALDRTIHEFNTETIVDINADQCIVRYDT